MQYESQKKQARPQTGTGQKYLTAVENQASKPKPLGKPPMQQTRTKAGPPSQTPSANKQELDSMQQARFLKTNLQEYFKNEDDRCISCSECMKGQDKLLQFKYPPNLKSNYVAEYNKFDPNARSQPFNLDHEKLLVKVPYKVPRDFTSTNKAEYRPYKVAPQGNQNRNAFDAELNNPCFIGATTYNKTYVDWGAAPNVKPTQVPPTFINMRIQDQTTYKEQFGGRKEDMPDFIKEHDKKMKKECV